MIVTDFDDAVRTYPRLASGATAPVRELQGAATLINNPLETALDPVNDELYTTTANIDGANHAGILVFDRTATGNVAPKRTIAGTNTHLDPSTGVWVALDLVNRELYVSADNGAGIAVFDMTANGNVAPKREIIGAATTLDHASTMLVDNTSDRLDVVLTNRVVVFPRTTSGNVAPVQELTVSDATSLWGFATDGSTGLTGP
jgi:hypothetical protein